MASIFGLFRTLAGAASGASGSVTGVEKAQQGLDTLQSIMQGFRIEFDLSDRSQLIAAVHKVFGDVSGSLAGPGDFDVTDDEDFRQALQAAFGSARSISDVADKGEEIQDELIAGFAEAMRRLMVAQIDSRGLIDTGEFKADVGTCNYTTEED